MLKKLIWLMLMLALAAAGALSEEAFVPDDFSFSGGTGRVTITCPQVTVKDGKTWAKIVFSSPHYAWVKVDGVEYDTLCDDATSTALVPVNINRATEILAMTSAMSAPHEIAYSLYVRVDALAPSPTGLPGLKWECSLKPDYAEGFSIDRYEGGYALIDVRDGARYLVVPEGMPLPEGMDPGIVILWQPLDHIYLTATSAMALINSLDALDAVRLSGTQADGWYVEEAGRAMEQGEILFAGKYSEPDFELLLREGCDLAVESMMISHAPKVQEMLELLKIPVFIDRSSNEPHPLGRVEWIKLYGALLGREEEAEDFFNRQARMVESLNGVENTGKSVAFFYINSNGNPVVRSATDYVPRMIELAGGRYAFGDLIDPGLGHASVNLTMEAFYDKAVNADFLVYNASIDQPLESLEDLLAREPLLADFKAVREGNVWCTGKYLYQATDILGELIMDFHRMLNDEPEGMTFLYRLDAQG